MGYDTNTRATMWCCICIFHQHQGGYYVTLYLYFPICDMTPPSGLLSTIFTFISGATSVATQYRVWYHPPTISSGELKFMYFQTSSKRSFKSVLFPSVFVKMYFSKEYFSTTQHRDRHHPSSPLVKKLCISKKPQHTDRHHPPSPQFFSNVYYSKAYFH